MTTTPVGDLHIDDFCKDAAKTLLILFRRFPVKTTLYVEDISGPDDPDEFGLHSPRFQACFSTLVWLRDTDYISYSQEVKQEAVEDAVLTHRAFSLLSGFDNSPLDEHESGSTQRRIDKIKSSLQNDSSEELKNLILGYMNSSRTFS